jgi:hypothetical protein
VVRHGGPVDEDVVIFAEFEEFFLVNYIPISVMMKFGTPK